MHSFFQTLARLQVTRPWIFIALGFVCALVAIPGVQRLGLNSDWTALLPKDQPSVRDLDRVRNRMSGLSTLTIALQSKDSEALKRFARDLAPKLLAMRKEGVRAVDWNVSAYGEFVRKHRHLYASLEELRNARDTLQERLDYERLKRNPLFVSLDDEGPPDLEGLVNDLRTKEKERIRKVNRFPDGFYLHPDGDFLALFIRTDVSGGNVRAVDRLVEAIRVTEKKLGPRRYARDLRMDLAGDLIGAREEHEAIARELVIATIATTLLVLLAIFGLFRTVRSIVLLGVGVATPVLLTFAAAAFTVKSLNASTAFLGSIVIGNGINPMIVWLARYFEERRNGQPIDRAVSNTHLGVWSGTLTASSAAAVAYGSLTITAFRGFRDFGVIGCTGMALCWLGMITILPALVVVMDRFRPLVQPGRTKEPTGYGVWLYRVAAIAPKRALVLCALFTIVAVVAIAIRVAGDPLEYNFRNLRSVREGSVVARNLNRRANEIVGKSLSGSAIAMLADDHEQAIWLKKTLESAGKRKRMPYSAVRSIDDLLPQDQDEKIGLLVEIRKMMLEARPLASAREARLIDEYLPPVVVRKLSISDLPNSVARPFSEKDGTRGRVLLIEEQKGRSTWDGRYLVAWAESLRKVRTKEGERPPLAGRAPVFADMIQVVRRDGPLVMAFSFFATLLLVLSTFRRASYVAMTISSLLMGILWMTGAMAIFGMKINFLNFLAWPITFGMGVDYSVNIVRRYMEEIETRGAAKRDAIEVAVAETGGAVALCSLTTIIGYISLFTSANQALNSFGAAMSMSEVTCLVAATLALPSYVLLRKASEIEQPAERTSDIGSRRDKKNVHDDSQARFL